MAHPATPSVTHLIDQGVTAAVGGLAIGPALAMAGTSPDLIIQAWSPVVIWIGVICYRGYSKYRDERRNQDTADTQARRNSEIAEDEARLEIIRKGTEAEREGMRKCHEELAKLKADCGLLIRALRMIYGRYPAAQADLNTLLDAPTLAPGAIRCRRVPTPERRYHSESRAILIREAVIPCKA